MPYTCNVPLAANVGVAGLSKSGRSLSVVNVPVEELEVGDRVLVAGQRKGLIRFAGETDFAPGLKPSHSLHYM